MDQPKEITLGKKIVTIQLRAEIFTPKKHPFSWRKHRERHLVQGPKKTFYLTLSQGEKNQYKVVFSGAIPRKGIKRWLNSQRLGQFTDLLVERIEELQKAL